MRAVRPEEGKTKFPSVQATSVREPGRRIEPKTWGWAPRTTWAPAWRHAAANCCWRASGAAWSSVPQWKKQTTTSARRRAARTSASIELRSARAVPGLELSAGKPSGFDVGVAEERDPETAGLDERRAARLGGVRPGADRLHPGGAHEAERVEQRAAAEVDRVVVREREHVEAGEGPHRRQRLGRAAERVLLLRGDAGPRDRRSRDSRS